MNRFGQCCLLARRLIEAGVRFVTINTFLTVFDEITWDIHGSKTVHHHRRHEEHCRADVRSRLLGTVIQDLDQRGMLNDTLVAGLAEFGRTPKVNPAGGRDHCHNASPARLLAVAYKAAERLAQAIRLVPCLQIVPQRRAKSLPPFSNRSVWISPPNYLVPPVVLSRSSILERVRFANCSLNVSPLAHVTHRLPLMHLPMITYRQSVYWLIGIACFIQQASALHAAESTIAILPHEVQLHGVYSQQRISVVAAKDDRIGREW